MARPVTNDPNQNVLLLDPTGRVRPLLESGAAASSWTLKVSEDSGAACEAIQLGRLPAVMLLTINAGREGEALAALRALRFGPTGHPPRIVALLDEDLCLDVDALLRDHEVDSCWQLDSLTPSILDGIVISELRTFSRTSGHAPLAAFEALPVDLNAGLDSALHSLCDEIDPGIQVIREYTDIPSVQCDPGMLGEVFVDLIRQAVQALGDTGGTIRIATSTRNEHVVIAIQDCAALDEMGASPPLSDVASTGSKPRRASTATRSIVEHHGGHLERSAQGVARTEIRVHLPINGAVDASRVIH